jgi:hypothetical protein
MLSTLAAAVFVASTGWIASPTVPLQRHVLIDKTPALDLKKPPEETPEIRTEISMGTNSVSVDRNAALRAHTRTCAGSRFTHLPPPLLLFDLLHLRFADC